MSFKVLHSSAGAGKTHALVKHYLAHCLSTDEPSGYRRVLALTFTGKAAAEMKQRVLEYLEGLASGDRTNGQVQDVRSSLCDITGDDGATIDRRASTVLSHMLHHWGDVAISTIDAFTRRVVRPFARDLQLDHELRMTTEEEHYRRLAVISLIGDAGVEPTVTGLLTEACLQLLHEERPWDPEKPLVELSAELTRERAIGPLQQLGTLEAGRVVALASRLRNEEAAFRRQVRQIGKDALELISSAGLTAADLVHGSGGIHGYFNKLAAFNAEWDAPGRNTLKPIETGRWNSTKADGNAIQALATISPSLCELFQRAETLRNEGHRAFVIRRAVARELLAAYTLHNLNERLAQLKEADGVTFFSDLTRKVAAVVREEPVPFIHERMGERYQHYLIDEFQDTSLLQWNALLPLIDSALATGGSALLVGDAKQAIYRWRNGEVRLFTHFPALYGRGDDPLSIERERSLQRNFERSEPLASNWRSSPTIIAFNNALFGHLATLLPPDLQSVYAEHAQRPERTGEGLVHIEVLEKESTGEERVGIVLEFTLRHVRQALADGFAPGDIAVLVRTRRLGSAVADHLVAHDIAVISPDGLQLSGDPVIELLIDHLRYQYNGDPAAAARIVQNRARLNADRATSEISLFDTHEALPHMERIVDDLLRSNGSPRLRTTLADLVGQLATMHGLGASTDAPLLTLLDEVHAWTTEHGQDMGGFLAHWDRSGGQRSTVPPEHGQAVQVMTVHRSKGLQFPVVIVPDTNMGSSGAQGERHWIHPGPVIPELPVALVRESKSLTHGGITELDEERDLRLLDQLDLLYVAFTRPEQRLVAMASESRADVFTMALIAEVRANGADGIWRMGEQTAPWKTKRISEQEFLTAIAGEGPMAGLALRLEAPEDWSPSDPDPLRTYGNVVHAILSRVGHAGEFHAALDTAVHAGELDDAAAATLATRLGPVLHSPELAGWFGSGLTVRTETTIIDAAGHAYRPDRTVLDHDHAGVLDIKTGSPSAAHHDQVRSYMRLLHELGYATVKGALLYVRTGELVNVAP